MTVDSELFGDRLPTYLTRFVGRAAELADLRTACQQTTLVTICGVGGILSGKQMLTHRYCTPSFDRTFPALLEDLAARCLLDETLVLWAGEMGRTPHAASTDGRDHHVSGYTIWMAGGGVKGGMAHGSTDEFGYRAVENPVHIHDWHATVLHLLGLDHERLTFQFQGRNFRLTDVAGRLVDKLLA